MKHFLLLAMGLSIFCACRKSENVEPTTEVVYPHKKQFTGTLKVFHHYDHWLPTLTYDTAYPQILEVVYLDSSRAFFNFFYWDYARYLDLSVASYSLVLSSTTSISEISDLNQINMKVGNNGFATVSNDSLLVNYPASTAVYNYLSISFTGKKL
jgi:hypothetical protein